ncbi:MAG: polyprenyl synthetase family protein [Acidimicrobiales bacterium]
MPTRHGARSSPARGPLQVGKYTVERPLHVGAALADRYDEMAASLSAYGDPLGEAFQLRDDMLDVFGDSSLLGKPIGDDLREGKPTPLLAATVARCPPRQAGLLARVGMAGLTTEEVDAIRLLMDDCGARAEMEAVIAQLPRERSRRSHWRPSTTRPVARWSSWPTSSPAATGNGHRRGPGGGEPVRGRCAHRAVLRLAQHPWGKGRLRCRGEGTGHRRGRVHRLQPDHGPRGAG